MTLADAYVEWTGYFTEGGLEMLLAPELGARGTHATKFIRELLRESPRPNLNDVSRTELSFLPFNVLEYADKMSMAHSSSFELRS
jgi:hypothetical protein